MAKIVKRIVKIQFMGASAKPGAALASLEVNMPQFCTAFNAATQNQTDELVPALVTVYTDKSFDLTIKTTPTSFLLKKKANLTKGVANSKTTKNGELTMTDIRAIAQYKLPDLNTNNLDQAIKIVLGTAKTIGITVTDQSS